MMPDRPIDAARPLKVIYIGAGVSGIVGAIQFRKMLPSVELVIYEKNPEIGGTWYENRYPGCACDIPSHAYQLSFESWTEWSHFYASAAEIWEYWNRVANKHDIRKHIQLNHKCVEAQWNETNAKWTVKLERLDASLPIFVEDEADVLVTGTGLLNEWKWPTINGLHSFEGNLLHTTNWDDNIDLTDKDVAVIGAGSSGIQIVPSLVNKAKTIDHYIRGKTWISNQINEEMLKEQTSDSNFEYSEEEREFWKKHPAAYVKYRKTLETGLQSMWEITQRHSTRHANARLDYEKNMRRRLASKPELVDQLIPDFPSLCKRLTPGPGYLEALTAPNVKVISQAISRVTKDGIITVDGSIRPVDAIVCATGFETDPGHGFPIYGRDGINLRNKYKLRPKTYLGLCTDNFPNFFQSLGPNAFQGAGSLLITIEYTHSYIGKILQRLAYGNVRTIEPKRKQVDNFTNFCEEYFKKTVYNSDCVSWYKSLPASASVEQRKNARVTALWPGSSIHAIHVLESVRWDDFDMATLDGNDFGWFGNGSCLVDRNHAPKVEDLTWYLDQTEFLYEHKLHQPKLTFTPEGCNGAAVNGK